MSAIDKKLMIGNTMKTFALFAVSVMLSTPALAEVKDAVMGLSANRARFACLSA